MTATASWRCHRRVRLASEALLTHGAALMMSSLRVHQHAIPSSNRSVCLATRFSEGGVHVDRRWLSIHAYGAQEPFSPAAVKACLSHTLSIGMGCLARPPWHRAVEWR